jgi:predicted MPP superfamily phosphohydrolase
MFHLIFGLPWLLVLVRFIQPLPWPFMAKVMVAGVLLVASQYHLANRLSSGSVLAPEFPRPLIILFNWMLGTLLLLAVFQLAADVVTLLLSLAKGRLLAIPPEVRYGIGAAALALSAFGVSQAIRVPPLKEVAVSIRDLPPEFEGYRLLQLTDLHISRLFPAGWVEKVVERSNALEVDLVVVTGDFIDGTLSLRHADIAPLSRLTAPDGVYAIPGNHEYYFGYHSWVGHYESLGMDMLINRHVVLRRGDSALVVAGVADLAARGSMLPQHDLKASLHGAPDGAPVILLDHQPRMAARAAGAGVALQLSGHTHGGMVAGLDRLVSRANSGFVSGSYDVDGMHLYVNNGTGLWPGFALRLGRPAELTVITLRGKG